MTWEKNYENWEHVLYDAIECMRIKQMGIYLWTFSQLMLVTWTVFITLDISKGKKINLYYADYSGYTQSIVNYRNTSMGISDAYKKIKRVISIPFFII